MEESFILYGILIFMWIEYLWELYIAIRQHKVYKTAVNIPPELKEVLAEESYEKARVYGYDRSQFGIFKDMFSIIVSTILILANGFVILWNAGGSLISYAGYSSDHEILQSLGFIFCLNVLTLVVGLPFSIYHTFVLEEKHGFNKQVPSFFIKDKIKLFFVTQVIVLPIMAGVIYIVKMGGDFFFMYLWLFSMLVMFFLLTIFPDYIAPLFDKYTPLQEGELKTQIEELAASINFPLYKLYVVDGSKRSAHSNAYFYGFFKNKRIVLFDTLLKGYKIQDDSKNTEEEKIPVGQGETTEAEPDSKESSNKTEEKGCDNEEVLAVLAHELGHWKLNHVFKNIVIMQLNLLLMFLAFGLLYKKAELYHAFGFYDEKPVIIGLYIILQFVFSPYNSVLNFLLTILSRSFEFQADHFAKSLGRADALRKALIKLNLDNLGFPVYDSLYSMWHNSHPPLLERLKALDKTD